MDPRHANAIGIAVFVLAAATLTAVFVLATGCASTSSGGGITIAQNDSTPPTLTLQVGQPSGQNAAVSVGGPPKTVTLTKKTGPLNVLATARDPESGLQAVRIQSKIEIADCDAAMCSYGGSVYAPFESLSPQLPPGSTTAALSVLAHAENLSTGIPADPPGPGRSLTVTFIYYAQAVNHLGQLATTPEIKAVWVEP